MLRKLAPILVFIALSAGGFAVYLGQSETDVGLTSFLELWSDVVRDTDQVGLQLTRTSEASEMKLGAKMSEAFLRDFRENRKRLPRVQGIGARLTPHLRRKGIQYRFHVLESPRINAYSMPGGQILVLRGLLDAVHSDDELAYVIAHEISHVDLRHCIERCQYEQRLNQLGKLIDLTRSLATQSYSKYQELDADAHAIRLMQDAGYDSRASLRLIHRMRQASPPTHPSQARTPLGEVGHSLEDALGSYLNSHPSWSERIERLEALSPTS